MTDLTNIQLTQCEDCRDIRKMADLTPLDASVLERVAPGEGFPAGDCPNCGAFAHILGLTNVSAGPGWYLDEVFRIDEETLGAGVCESCMKDHRSHVIVSLGRDTWRYACKAELGLS